MITFRKRARAGLLIGAIALFTPGESAAQLQMSGGVGASFPGPIRTFPIGPLGVPYGVPSFNYSTSLNVRVGTPFGPSIGFSQQYNGMIGWWLSTHNTPLSPRYNIYPRRSTYNTNYRTAFLSDSRSRGYMSGGVVNNTQYYRVQGDFGRAQRQATLSNPSAMSTRGVIANVWDFEKGARPADVPGAAADRNAPQDLVEAIQAGDDAKLLSGEYLNRISTAIRAAEAQGGRGSSAQIGPQLLNEIRFTGSPAADALMVIRQAGSTEFPAAFESVATLQSLQPALEQDIVVIASSARLGKPAEPQKAIKFDADVHKAQNALTPELANLTFEDAVAARRFLNQLAATAKVARDSRQLAGLVNPQWETAGVSVADLVKFMARHKLQFGPSGPNATEAYLTLHQGLSNYLFVLEKSIPSKKKK